MRAAWLANSVNSPELCAHLAAEGAAYDRIVVGPYLFGLSYFASRVHPRRTYLVPCLHDEPFARVRAFRGMFRAVNGLLLIPRPSARWRAGCMTCRWSARVGGRHGIDNFTADPAAFVRGMA